MTAKELITKLRGLPPESEVVVLLGGGDKPDEAFGVLAIVDMEIDDSSYWRIEGYVETDTVGVLTVDWEV